MVDFDKTKMAIMKRVVSQDGKGGVVWTPSDCQCEGCSTFTNAMLSLISDGLVDTKSIAGGCEPSYIVLVAYSH